MMMSYEKSDGAQDNFGKFIHQFQTETKTLIRKLEMILIKLYTQYNMCLFLFIQSFLNERLQLKYTHTHTQTHIYTYIYIYIYIYIYALPVKSICLSSKIFIFSRKSYF